MPVYYPSLCVNFRLQFEEALQDILPSPTGVDDLANAPTLPFNGKTLVPLYLAGPSKANRLSQVQALVPKICDVALNGYRQAGKFKLTMPWIDLPVHPLAIRALGVEVYLDSVDSKDFAQGMVNRQIGRRVSVVNPNPDPLDGNQLFIGVADEISTDWSDKGISLQIEGRDLKGLLLDLPFSPTALKQLKHNQTISSVVRQILSLHPSFAGAELEQIVQVVPDDFSNSVDFPDGEPILAAPGDLTRIQQGADGQSPGVGTQGDPNKISFWDIITQYCFLVGVVPFFVGEVLHLRPARKLYEVQQQDKSFDPLTGRTPFKDGFPRYVRTGTNSDSRTESFSYRRMVYGKNILSLKMDRKLGGRKPPTVICYSLDTSGAQGRGFSPLEGQWPTAAPGVTSQKLSKQKITTVGAGGEVTQSEVLRVPVHGFNSQARLQTIAHHLYEEISRQEIGGCCSTKDLASFGGDNSDPDLLKLRPGDAVEFRIPASATSSPLVNQITDFNAMSEQAAIAAVQKRVGGDEDLARAIVATARGSVPDIQRTFRVGNVKYHWDASNGVAIDFDFQNYVEVRNDVETQGNG